MDLITSVSEMRHRCLTERQAGKTISFVPTMGYLHQGHVSLLEAGRKRGDLLVLSIFVNPTQFGQGEDFEVYPRDLAQDSVLAEQAGVDIIFAPDARQMYPSGYATYVDVERLTETLCGASRAGHFRGVCTVVNKLFNIVQPQVSLFGCKDFQQLAVIRQMVADLNMPVEIIGLPIVREKDGLAMSSRNVNLNPKQRQQALILSSVLRQCAEQARAGERDALALIDFARQQIEFRSEARIDYLQICNQTTLQDVTLIDEQAVMLLAVFFGQTRLIDNGYLLQ
ncbi:MAG TPA: pantoate--beta-alanine ligase [Geopsychrobacteraceae bacterium]|nr:pantoate--beta-alanine ligase [Geopsychrobacteraceae bacterium]